MRVVAIFILVFVTTLSHGQVLISLVLGDRLNSGKVEFGLDGGISYPQMRGLNDGKLKGVFNLGFYFDIKTKNPRWLFHTGVMVKSSMGTSGLPVYPLNNGGLDSAFRGGQVQRKINYFNVPFMMKYKFMNSFYAEGGIMPSLRSNAFDIFTNRVNGDHLEYKVETGNQYYRLDFGLIAGIGYRLMKGHGMNLTVRYYYGLVDITSSKTVPNQYNKSLYLAVGIPIGIGKAKKREQDKNKQ